MIKCPCYKCEDREVGCHGKCQKPEYLKYELRAEERRQLIREGKAKEHHMVESINTRVNKTGKTYK